MISARTKAIEKRADELYGRMLDCQTLGESRRILEDIERMPDCDQREWLLSKYDQALPHWKRAHEEYRRGLEERLGLRRRTRSRKE